MEERTRWRGEERTRWRVRERDTHNLEREASTDHPRGRVGLTLKLDELL